MTKTEPDQQPPLTGITVISLEQAIAAPLATRHLADHGARVIKIERPGMGDFARDYDRHARGMASHFVWVNRSKESLCLDLKNEQAQVALRRILAKADVLVQNLAPGATERLRLGYTHLAASHPHLIVCDISGYGDSGPYANKKAYDLLVQSESGLLSITGTPDQAAKCGISIADIAAGMYAYSSILMALIERSKTGLGRRIDITMLECMAEWMGFPLYYGMDEQSPPSRSGAEHATIAPYGPFRCGDGNNVMLGLQNEREWDIFCRDILEDAALINTPQYADNTARTRNRIALRKIIESNFAQYTIAQTIARLDAAGIANASINTVDNLWQHAQLQSRGRWREVNSPAGKLPALLPPGINATDPAAFSSMRPIPDLGEHSAQILNEFGFSTQQVNELCGVI